MNFLFLLVRGGTISLESILYVEEPTDNTLLYLALGKHGVCASLNKV